MTSLTTLPTQQAGWGTTSRRDAWWVGPFLTVLGLSAFLIYGFVRAWMGGGYEVRESSDFHAGSNRAICPHRVPGVDQICVEIALDPPAALTDPVVAAAAGFLIGGRVEDRAQP